MCHCEALSLGFGVFPLRGKSMYIVHIWPTGLAKGRAVPPDVREEPAGTSMRPFSIGSLHCLTPYGGKAVSDHPSDGGNGLSRPGGNIGFGV